jgi:CRP-like cAMP-binding protein
MGENPSFGDHLEKWLIAEAAPTTVVRLAHRECLYTVGEVDPHVYWVVAGQLKATTVTASGRGCLLDIYRSGDVIGESCLLRAERNETVTAMVPSRLRRIPRLRFRAALTEGLLLEPYLRCLTERLWEQQEIITHMVTADSEQRLAATLLRLARKLGTEHCGHVQIDAKITHDELSDMVGTTRSRIGYFLKRFRNDAIVRPSPDHTLVIDLRRLNDYLAARL